MREREAYDSEGASSEFTSASARTSRFVVWLWLAGARHGWYIHFRQRAAESRGKSGSGRAVSYMETSLGMCIARFL